MVIKRKAVPPPRPAPFKGPLNSHPTARPFAPILQRYQFPTQQRRRSRTLPSDDEVSPLHSPSQDRHKSSTLPAYSNAARVIDLWVAQAKPANHENLYRDASILEPHILNTSPDPSRGRIRGSPNLSDGGLWPIDTQFGIGVESDMGEHVIHGQLPSALRIGTPDSQQSSFDSHSSQDEWTEVSPQRGPSAQRDTSPRPAPRNNPFQRSRSSSRQAQDRKPLVSQVGEIDLGERERTSIVSPLEDRGFSNNFNQPAYPQASLLDDQDFSGAPNHSIHPTLQPFEEHSSANVWAEQPALPPPPSRAAPPPPRAAPPPPPAPIEEDESSDDDEFWNESPVHEMGKLSISEPKQQGALKNRPDRPPLITLESVNGNSSKLLSPPGPPRSETQDTIHGELHAYLTNDAPPVPSMPPHRQESWEYEESHYDSPIQTQLEQPSYSVSPLKQYEGPDYQPPPMQEPHDTPTFQNFARNSPPLSHQTPPPRADKDLPPVPREEYEPPPGPPPMVPTAEARERFEQEELDREKAAKRSQQSSRLNAWEGPSTPAPPRPSGPDLEALHAKIAKQRNETYQIKHIIWSDSPTGKTRSSPIMIQNTNGPCPLLALVNALTLSTPSDLSTSLVDTLRTKEQISLGLLLEAVFEELMSGRRGSTALELPDVGDLYAFLITLHTGMNVNPQFFPPPSHGGHNMTPCSSQNTRQAGTFEETKEMKLYSTFHIPLIHGWLPPRNHPAYGALQRSAATYEDAQNLLFHEEVLEHKLQNDGLSEDEQRLLGDISSIKYFLSSAATQLTGYGLDIITETVEPDTIAILFRNDHFSTLYKHPKSGLLMTLVTDMGYATHDEVVWETLVDIRGEGSEFLAGDFRPVGNSQDPGHQNSAGPISGDDWTTVQRSNPSSTTSPNTRNDFAPLSATSSIMSQHQFLSLPEDDVVTPKSHNTEQEDHDLALALQLQEEEEDRSRRETEERRHQSARENELSRAFLDRQGNQGGQQQSRPNQPNSRRQSNPRPAQTIRPLVPPRGGSNIGSSSSPRTPNTPSSRQPGASRQSSNAPPGANTPPLSASSSHASIPPPTSLRPVATAPRARPADPEAGIDMPPPSYEDAAKEAPYIPPEDDPVYSDHASAAASAEAQAQALRAAEAKAAELARRQAPPAQPQRPRGGTGGHDGRHQGPPGQGGVGGQSPYERRLAQARFENQGRAEAYRQRSEGERQREREREEDCILM